MAKQIGSQYDFQKIPIIGLVPEQKTTAPSAPVNGQLWFDSTLNVLKVWEVNQWLLVANTAGGSTPAGPAGGDLTGSSYPNPTLAAGAVTLAKLATALTDGTAGSKQVRALGTGATDAAAGNDGRFGAASPPNGSAGGDLTGTYPNPGIAAGVIVVGDLATSLTDGTAGSKQVRAIGATATDAAAGNHGHVLTDAVITGTLPNTKGGTGQTAAFTTGGVVYGQSTTALGTSVLGTSGQLLSSNGSSAPSWITHDASLHATYPLDTFAAPAGASLALGGKKISGLGDGTAPTDAVTKQQLDAMSAGLDTKQSVYLATTANIALTGALSIDGVVAGNNRVLVKNQTLPAENGIYQANNAGAWTRATDMDNWAEVPGAFTFVEQGSTQADTGWVCTADVAGGVIGTTAMPWAKFSSPGQVIDGAGLLMTGNTLDVGQGNGIVVGTDSISVSWGGNGSATSSSRSDHNHDTTYAPLTRTISTTAPLTGGGDLSANRTLAVNAYSGGANTGVVPTGGSATTYLRGDGTWVTPPAGTTQKFAGLVGALAAGVETLFTHSLGTQDVVVSFRDASTNRAIDFDWRAASTTQIGITTDVVGGYAANAIRAVVIG